jgi:hypothetical protein
MTDPRFSFAGSLSTANTAELRDRLSGTVLVIEVTSDALAIFPGQVLAYQLATVAARLFDRIELAGDDGAPVHRHFPLLVGAFLPELRRLLPTLRPLTPEPANGRTVRVVIGDEPVRDDATSDLFVGAVDWVALLSTSGPQPVREGTNPCGALAAGALAAAEMFKLIFDGRLSGALRASDINLSLLTYAPVLAESLMGQPALPEHAAIDPVLVGCGSVGCAFLEGVMLTPVLAGHVTTVDNGVFDLRNPYKYALLDWAAAQGALTKAEWARDQIIAHAGSRLGARRFVGTANQYIATLPEDYRIPVAVSAVDTMEARLEIQDMLPGAVVNAGINGTLVEVSSHDFGRGPCLGCLAMRQPMESWNAEPIATATGLRPERVLELIGGNGPITQQDVNEIIGAGKIRMDLVLELEGYVGQPLLSFVNRMPYAETLVTTLVEGASARVTTAFVSAFAGALLFAEFLKTSLPALEPYRVNNSYRQDLLGVPADGLFRYERDPEGWCACYSPFRLRVHEEKYGTRHGA